MKGVRGPRIPGKRVQAPKKGKGAKEQKWVPDDYGPRGTSSVQDLAAFSKFYRNLLTAE